MNNRSKFITFQTPVSGIEKPKRFTFPFYYDPHPLAQIAMDELQDYLERQTHLKHNFGLENNPEGLVIGKMFGVLVVENKSGELGYLAAFSGKLADSNNHEHFVPPVFDLLEDNGFFRGNERLIHKVTLEIEALEQEQEFQMLKQELKELEEAYQRELKQLKSAIKEGKAKRKAQREVAVGTLNFEDLEVLLENLRRQSIKEQYFLKDFNDQFKKKQLVLKARLEKFETQIVTLKEKRKSMSNSLQKDIFDSYYFLNSNKEKRSLQSIFEHTSDQLPPAGAGECAAPKLLQYAFEHDLKPICMGEFWWGASPKSEVRVHKQVYPSCRGKCEPILGFMLEGMAVDPNPMLVNPAENKELEIVYEDDYLLVINKPEEFLSVPGKTIVDSVYTRVRAKYPDATGPLIVHRLDMSTSGLLVIAKDKATHFHLQRQFTKRTVKKRYVALLDGVVQEDSGTIDLPLRVDLDDRPRQLVCYEYGKRAVTKWEVVSRSATQTMVHFYPITGRTHQLRMHAAHSLGLNAPIVGDDLYGKRANRLHLHAESLEFIHPITKEVLKMKVKEQFSIG